MLAEQRGWHNGQHGFAMTGMVVTGIAWQKLGGAAGKGCFVEDSHGPRETGMFLDDFEQRLQRKGRALVAMDGRCLLVDGNDVSLFAQKKQPVFAGDAEHDGLQAFLERRLDVRKLHVTHDAMIAQGQAVLRDDEEKALARIDVLEINDSALLMIRPLRGYERKTDRYIAALHKAGAVSGDVDIAAFVREAAPVALADYSLKPVYGLAADMPAHLAVARMTAVMLDIARRNEAGMVTHADDIEYLHHYRVCLRKVRSLVSLLKEIWPVDRQQDLKSRLGDLARRTNELRDLDVWMEDRDYYDSLLPDSLRTGLPVMFGHFARRHKAARGRVARWINSPAYEQEITALMAQLADPAGGAETAAGKKPVLALVQKKIRKRYDKICRLGLAINPATPDEDVHELRIEGKKLRYLLEFFAELLDPAAHKAFLKKMKRLQDNLGLFNDYSVQQEDLLAFQARHADDTDIARTVGALVAELARRQKEQRHQVEINFAGFADDESAGLVDMLTGKTIGGTAA